MTKNVCKFCAKPKPADAATCGKAKCVAKGAVWAQAKSKGR